ncbi:MAG: hypothetical protein HC915_05665 [Anaerolineae bacterium]|nr:hypothetical protein [Anaerolineae bacterium]
MNNLKTRSELPFHIVSMYEYQIAMHEAEIAWFDQWIERWRAQQPALEPEKTPSTVPLTPRMQQVVLPNAPDSPHKLATRVHPRVEKEDPSGQTTRINRDTDMLDRDNLEQS